MQKTILIVEDDRDLAEAVGDVLREEGYAVLLAGDGRQALERLHDGTRPVLILLDLMMPIMDGWQFRRAQLENEALAAIPVIAFSAHGDGARNAASLDAAGFIGKPLRIGQLLDAVAKVCGEA